MSDPEYITIVEGPTPEFRASPDLGIHSVLEGPQDYYTAMCEMRTLNGRGIVERCQQAWKEGRSVRLDFPDEMRLRKELDVAALRLEEVDEGMVLQVWVWQPVELLAHDEEEGEGDDDRYDFN